MFFVFCRRVAPLLLGWLLGGFLVSGVCFASAPSRGGVVLFAVGAGSFALGWLGVLC